MFPTVLTQTSFDSGALSGLASIAHPLREAGYWRLSAAGRRAAPGRQFDVIVREGGKARYAIELTDGDRRGPMSGLNEGFLAPGGMINLAARAARTGWHAFLFGDGLEEPLWDSRVLQEGDGYACMPMRPGSYRIENLLNGAVGRLRVAYPDPRAIAEGVRLATTPVRVTAGTAITPDSLRIDPGQLLIFAIDSRCRLAITLEEPDDGAPELAVWREQRSRTALERVLAKPRC